MALARNLGTGEGVRQAAIVSPCVNVCRLTPDNVCAGCGRTVSEIRNWRHLGWAQRLTVLGRVGARRLETGMDILPRDILGFWFSAEARSKWYAKDDAFDREIRTRFETAWSQAVAGDFAAWEESADGALALVILLDQFPRNMFRGTPQAFASDPLALAATRRALDKGFDTLFEPARRLFLYLPLEHDEDLASQRRCVALLEANGDDPQGLDYARRHLAIVERFGRFPHRNAILGRVSTPEERAFLEEPNSSF